MQLTSKMGSWVFVSQLPFIALFSWNVHGFPAKGAPPVPTDPNDPAVSFMYDPVRLGTAGVQTSPPNFRATPAQLETGQLGHDEGNLYYSNSERGTHGLGSTTAFQSGALSKYVATYEHGNSERETEDYFRPVLHAYPFALPGAVSQYYLRPAPPVDWLAPLWYGVH
ncbi:uncharacterized protein LOC116322205 isoform X5 [Oreochromis aureus]|uniref:uncharacterized protein LOC116322205 isoform X5 n=1 Tax=Oreochromis aureus TaxID=47969 RepID=UPI001952A24F|nr:uncharacterized protein LOC116322205 isoform X5 [Oreochromis aureus]